MEQCKYCGGEAEYSMGIDNYDMMRPEEICVCTNPDCCIMYVEGYGYKIKEDNK